MTGHQRLVLTEGRWYGWQMLPGYGDGCTPYFSPIKIGRVSPHKTGRSILSIDFFNAGYAHGVQDFSKEVQIVNHQADYLVGRELDAHSRPGDRTVIVSRITVAWIAATCPHLMDALPPQGDGAQESAEDYLNRIYRR